MLVVLYEIWWHKVRMFANSYTLFYLVFMVRGKLLCAIKLKYNKICFILQLNYHEYFLLLNGKVWELPYITKY